VTEGKSDVVAMTERETTAKENWRKRKRKPPRVPGMPWVSFKVCLGIAIAWSVMGGASIGWTEGCTIDIDIAKRGRTRTPTKKKEKQRVFGSTGFASFHQTLVVVLLMLVELWHAFALSFHHTPFPFHFFFFPAKVYFFFI